MEHKEGFAGRDSEEERHWPSSGSKSQGANLERGGAGKDKRESIRKRKRGCQRRAKISKFAARWYQLGLYHMADDGSPALQFPCGV